MAQENNSFAFRIALGHYHALWKATGDEGGNKDPEGQAIIDAQQALLLVHTQLLQYGVQHGYSFDRWAEVVNMMLGKDPRSPRIHQLWVIHIYEADYNVLLAIKWRQAMHHCKDNCLFNEGLYGSRPGQSAQTPVNIKVHQNAIYQLSMISRLNLDLNATLCFDRIIISIASLCNRRTGMNKIMVLINSKTLQLAKLKIKTTLGLSEDFYQHSDAFPIHGTGQGYGNLPMILGFVCSVLFDALDVVATGVEFVSPNKDISVRMCMIGFVDDCTQQVNCFSDYPQPTALELVNLISAEAQIWHSLLRASGGKLEQNKCSYHLVESLWNTRGVPHFKSGTNTPLLFLHNGYQDQITIIQLSNYQAHQTLGCYIELVMTMKKQVQILKDKNEIFHWLVQTNCFFRAEAWTFYSWTYLPSMTYPFSNIVLKKLTGKIGSNAHERNRSAMWL